MLYPASPDERTVARALIHQAEDRAAIARAQQSRQIARDVMLAYAELMVAVGIWTRTT